MPPRARAAQNPEAVRVDAAPGTPAAGIAPCSAASTGPLAAVELPHPAAAARVRAPANISEPTHSGELAATDESRSAASAAVLASVPAVSVPCRFAADQPGVFVTLAVALQRGQVPVAEECPVAQWWLFEIEDPRLRNDELVGLQPVALSQLSAAELQAATDQLDVAVHSQWRHDFRLVAGAPVGDAPTV